MTRKMMIRMKMYMRTILILFLIGCTSVTVWGQTPASLTTLGDLGETGNYIITADIDASGYNSLASFSGTLEAAINPETRMPYRIMNLKAPLFTALTGIVRNLVLEDVNISGHSGNTGAVACSANGAARIYNVGVLSGSVGGTANTGGLVGLLAGTARVINCYSFANITGGSNVGGLVGNNDGTPTAGNITTMVMNCAFYGNITGGTTKSPVYGGNIINNVRHDSNRNLDGLNTFNYYCYETLTGGITDGKYNCALAVEKKYLTRFELYRHLLNSNKKLAAIYATGSADNANQMLKWVLETADRTQSSPKPFPILKEQAKFPSIVNPDVEHAPDSAVVGRNQGGKLGRTLSVAILTKSQKTAGGQSWPVSDACNVQQTSLTLVRTDMDTTRFNFNYDKVQLPYYNDVGTGNCTENRVVTGWKITQINGGTSGTFEAKDGWGGYNFADRKCTQKDLYSVSGRVFSQGAYYDVPYGVTSITIEPYWGKAAYMADEYYDVVYKKDFSAPQGVTQLSKQVAVGTTKFHDQRIETSVSNALSYINKTLGGYGSTVYDNAVVLVGNRHLDAVPSNGDIPFTMMSVDEDHDNEPDYSLIYHHKDRLAVSPIRFDFLSVLGTAQAQKPNGADLICNVSIFKTKGWFEITNTSSMYFTQFEYENLKDVSKVNSPLILQGGVFDQFVSTQSEAVTGKTIYIHVGGNVWFKEFGLGTHGDGSRSTPHVPVSVTGGDYDGFYLTGTYNQDATVRDDDAECYISGGHFLEAAGASQEAINGSVRWQIYNADMENFYGGGTNAAKPITGDVTVDIFNSHVTTFCGGPKFGNMQTGKKVTTRAEGCVFGNYFGAGFGGLSYSKKKYYDEQNYNFGSWQQAYTSDRGKYYDGKTTSAVQAKYGKKGIGVATDFDYEFFVWSKGNTGGRFYVKFASFSLAQCNDVESTLKKCVVNQNFYGGGSLGKVTGTATSVLEDCTVQGSVFGGGYSASLPQVPVRNSGFTKLPNYNKSSGMFEPAVWSDTIHCEWKNAAEAGVTLSNGELGSDLDHRIVYTDVDLHSLGQVQHTNLTIKGNTIVHGIVNEGTDGGVFGGGDESKTNGNTAVNIEGGTVSHVYGGGNVANVEGNTKVSLTGGTVAGDVYGGGRGRHEVRNASDEVTVTGIAATVGDALVELNKDVDDTEKGCVVGGCIFGCNNLNGTPLGAVTVHVYKTQKAGATRITNPAEGEKTAKVIGDFDLKAVYGGGNLAAYEPTNALLEYNETNKATVDAAYAHVIIDGCDRTSIRYVYGGGNAASTPGTLVDINGTFEIEEVFGGGNGRDQITINGVQKDNPGANVGYRDYSAEEATYDTKEKRMSDAFAPYRYGSGLVNVIIHGGRIHHVYGGSNTKGNVRTKAMVALEELRDEEDEPVCLFDVDQAYGGGKSATMDGEAVMEMRCIPGLDAAYGGAENADVNNNVTLNITNGTFAQVFGGNNRGGRIGGSIVVNIEETGCRPIIIGELYGGGNRASYSIYGYKPEQDGEGNPVLDEGGKTSWLPIRKGEAGALATPYTSPYVNVKSFTSIGSIYGGGYGETAVMVGDPVVNINEVVGGKATHSSAIIAEEGTITINDELASGGMTTRQVTYPAHASGEIGAINNVFGGGNAAEVVGDTYVNIGTQSQVTYVTGADTTTPISVKGANIRGNVYGGGNKAAVTGNTHVNIGE